MQRRDKRRPRGGDKGALLQWVVWKRTEKKKRKESRGATRRAGKKLRVHDEDKGEEAARVETQWFGADVSSNFPFRSAAAPLSAGTRAGESWPREVPESHSGDYSRSGRPSRRGRKDVFIGSSARPLGSGGPNCVARDRTGAGEWVSFLLSRRWESGRIILFGDVF